MNNKSTLIALMVAMFMQGCGVEITSVQGADNDTPKNDVIVPIYSGISDDETGVDASKDISTSASTLSDAKASLLSRAKDIKSDSNGATLRGLTDSYLTYSHFMAQEEYGKFMDNDAPEDIWSWIDSNEVAKEALYSARFPANPYYVKNLAEFKNKWGTKKLNLYSNVAVGLSVNAREDGIIKEITHPDVYDKNIANYNMSATSEEGIRGWLEKYNINGYVQQEKREFRNYISKKYNLSRAEYEASGVLKPLKSMLNKSGKNIDNMDFETRKQYRVSFDLWNVHRLLAGKNRISRDKEYLPNIKNFIKSKNITASVFLIDADKYLKDKNLKVVSLNTRAKKELRGDLGVIPKSRNEYKLMSYYDLAEMKISNDNIAPKVFNDKERDWPIYDEKLVDTPWQFFTIEQSAQKDECSYAKKRFFETDKSKLEASYPDQSVNEEYKTRRLIESTTYTFDYNDERLWYKESRYAPEWSLYRIMQDGGVCGRQSTMGQHVNECLNRPTIGVGQPIHRAWVGVYKDDNERYLKVGYKVGNTESVKAFNSKSIYNIYTDKIRPKGLERFAGVVGGTTAVGVHRYNQSMILQHIAKIVEAEGSSPKKFLELAISASPRNIDAWYQLALYHAEKSDFDAIERLAMNYMQNYSSTFETNKKASKDNNLGAIVSKNIMMAMLHIPSVDGCLGLDGIKAKNKIFAFLDNHFKVDRTIITYREQNMCVANIHKMRGKKAGDAAGYDVDMLAIAQHFMENTETPHVKNGVGYVRDWFLDTKSKDFIDYNDTELLKSMATAVMNSKNSGRLTEFLYDVLHYNDLGLQRILTRSVIRQSVDNVSSLLLTPDKIDIIASGNLEVYLTARDTNPANTSKLTNNLGEAGYNKLLMSATSKDGKRVDIMVRVAKISSTKDANRGKLLHITDPSEVEPSLIDYNEDEDATGIVVWINEKDNTHLVSNMTYQGDAKVMLDVKQSDSDELLGYMSIMIKDFVYKGKSIVVDKLPFVKEYSESVYFTYVDGNQILSASRKTQFKAKIPYSKVTLNVKDKDGVARTMALRASNVFTNSNNKSIETSMNYSNDNIVRSSLKLSIDKTDVVDGYRYDANDDAINFDNTKLTSGKRYIGLEKIKVDVRRASDDTIIERLNIDVEIVMP